MAADLLLIVLATYVVAYAAIFVIDLRTRRIPNLLTYPLLVLSLVARPESLGLVPLGHVVVAVVTFACFACFALRGWMGMGDAKLAAVIGLASAPLVAVTALWLAFLVGGAVGLALLAARRVGRRSAIPFGPYLALAGMVAALAPGLLRAASPFGPLFG